MAACGRKCGCGGQMPDCFSDDEATPPKPSERDSLAKEMGRRHANPALRSMYPTASRGQIAQQFAQLFTLGWDAGAASERKRCEEMLEIAEKALSNCSNAEYCGRTLVSGDKFICDNCHALARIKTLKDKT